MFIIKGRGLGAVAGVVCAVVVTFLLGGCATPVARAGDDGPKFCERYGPSGDDRRCGTNQVYKAEAMLNGMVR
jgi:hypothetical protein